MKFIKPIAYVVSILVATSLACNLGVAAQPTEAPLASAATETVTSNSQGQETSTAPAATAQPTLPAIPTVTVSTDTNCRVGPNINYQLVMVFKVGMSAEVVATYPEYWVIKYPGGNGATCWLWGQHATVIGNTSNLPIATPPPLPATPTPEPTAPKAPKIIDISKSCQNVTQPGDLFPSWKVKVIITWEDRSDNETGFNIYKFGSQLVSVGENYTQYIDTFVHSIDLQGAQLEYGVQSYNSDGSSDIKDIQISACP